MSLETRKMGKSYVSFTKSQLIKFRDNLRNSVTPNWQAWLAGTGISALGLISIPVVGIISFGSATLFGALFLLPQSQTNVANKVATLVDQLNNTDNVIIEFQEEYVFDTVTDLNNKTISSRTFMDVYSWSNTGSTYISNQNLAAYIG